MAKMTIEKAVQKIYARSRGKDILSTPLAAGDSKYNQILDIIDGLQKDWQNQGSVEWQSLWAMFTLGVTVSATDTFALGTVIRTPSDREGDQVVVTDLGGNKYYYDIVDANQLRSYQVAGDATVCAVQGTNLVFAVPFATGDARIGGTIKVPGYGYVPDIDLTTNTTTTSVSVDDPMWLVYMGAAEFVRTDLVRQNQYPNLVARAADRMDAMEASNQAQIEQIDIDIDLTDMDPSNASDAWS